MKLGLLLAASASALQLRCPAARMQEVATPEQPATARASSPKVAVDWRRAVENAKERAAAVKQSQDATAAAMVVGTLGVYALPTLSNGPLDLFLSTLVGGGLLGYLAGFREDAAGDASRKAGGTVASAVGQLASKVEESGVGDTIKAKLPGSGGEGLSYAEIKKFGVAGTIAYILTELAFWAVAFPVASTSFYNLNGHWPDFGDGSDRAAVLAFIFAGANVARLVVPLRFGAAFALVPWVQENICDKFGIGDGNSGEAESDKEQ